MNPTAPLPSFLDRLSEVERHTEELCLFCCLESGFSKNDILACSGSTDGLFASCQGSIKQILPEASQKFFCQARKDPAVHYVLLMTTQGSPLLVVTTMARYGGLCFAVAPDASPEDTLAFLRTMPGISCPVDPAFQSTTPATASDPAVFAYLGTTFRRVFSLCESIYSTPAEHRDALSLFRLLKMKISCAAELFGIEASFVMQQLFREPLRKQIPVDMNLFAATTLLLLFSAQRFGMERRIHVVFMTEDRCPAVCVHFRIDSDGYQGSSLHKFMKMIYERCGCYFRTCFGAPAKKEAEKIPGVGHMILNDRYSALGDHALNLFSPIKRDWTEFVNRSPVFHLPEHFFDGFD